MVIAIYQMNSRFDQVFVTKLLFQVFQIVRVCHRRLLVVHIRYLAGSLPSQIPNSDLQVLLSLLPIASMRHFRDFTK